MAYRVKLEKVSHFLHYITLHYITLQEHQCKKPKHKLPVRKAESN